MAMMRAWTPADAEGVAALLAAVWADEPGTLPLFAVHGRPRDGREGFARTVVAEAGGALVGVGTVRSSWLHPARWRVAVHVAAPNRRRGIGSRLLAALVGEMPADDPRPWQAATRASDAAGRAFLARHGFRPLMRTRIGVLDPAALRPEDRRAIDAATRRVEAAGYRIGAGRTDRAAARASLAALHAEIYRLAHAWNPPTPLAEQVAAELFLGDDLLPDEVVVARFGGAAIGVASLRRADDPAAVELGWVGVVGEHRTVADDLVLALVGVCLRRAAAAGWRVEVEVDAADAPLWRLVDGWPVALEADWLTFALAAAAPGVLA